MVSEGEADIVEPQGSQKQKQGSQKKKRPANPSGKANGHSNESALKKIHKVADSRRETLPAKVSEERAGETIGYSTVNAQSNTFPDNFGDWDLKNKSDDYIIRKDANRKWGICEYEYEDREATSDDGRLAGVKTFIDMESGDNRWGNGIVNHDAEFIHDWNNSGELSPNLDGRAPIGETEGSYSDNLSITISEGGIEATIGVTYTQEGGVLMVDQSQIGNKNLGGWHMGIDGYAQDYHATASPGSIAIIDDYYSGPSNRSDRVELVKVGAAPHWRQPTLPHLPDPVNGTKIERSFGRWVY